MWNIQNPYEENMEFYWKDLEALVNGGLIIKINSSKSKPVYYQFKFQ